MRTNMLMSMITGMTTYMNMDTSMDIITATIMAPTTPRTARC